MRIAVWGNGLTAWVTAGVLAQFGNDIFMVNDSSKTNPTEVMDSSIRNEPGLKDLIEEVFAAKRLSFMESERAAKLATHIISLDATEFEQACQIVDSASTHNAENLLFINQSHFGVGFTDRLQERLDKEANQVVAYLAENISEGEALEKVRYPKSITLGCDNDWALTVIQALFRPVSTQLEQFFTMSPKEAEFAKFSITGMLALRIGYINELANLAEQLNVDIDVIKQSMCADPRIGQHYLSPGCGFGGSNFSQTLRGLANLLAAKRQSQLLDTVLEENENQKEQPFRKLWCHYECDIKDLNIAIWGASFKPGSSALDSAPSLRNINAIISQQAKVRIHDPEALENIEKLYGDNSLVETFECKYTALEKADALLLLTEWPEYSSPDYEAMLSKMDKPVIIDGRNLFSRALLEKLGFSYYGVGR